MKNLIIFLFCLLQACPVLAQAVNVVDKAQKQQNLTGFAVLADHGYNFNRVRADKSLKFIRTDSLLGARVYWLRVVIYNPTDKSAGFELAAFPDYDNTLYTCNPLTKKWTAHRSGIFSRIRPQLQGIHPYNIGGFTVDTVYLKINVNTPNVMHNTFKAQIILTPRAIANAQEHDTYTAWLVGTLILLLFFLNNVYIYLSFKDKTVLYYLVMQLGGIMYLSAYWYFFDWFIPYPVMSFTLAGHFNFYNSNMLILHAAIVIIFYCFVQLTRLYLNTRTTLPLCDKLLKNSLYIYIILSIIIASVNVSGFEIEYYTVGYDNVYCLLILLLVGYTSVIGYLRRLPTAGSFLLANALPLLCMCGVTIYHLFIDADGSHDYWMPVLAAVTQALGFSVAMVSRTRVIRESLASKEMESRQLAFDLKEASYRNQQINADMESERYRNELLNERVEAHQRELASSTLYMVQKNELLSHLKTQIKDLKQSGRYTADSNLDGMITLLENNNQLDSEWDKFKMHFEQVHPNFFEDLKRKHPTLTQKETRLYAYFEMKLSHKEIAALLDIDPASVRRAKTRLLKKMNMPDKDE